ncbi:hypothetical protein A2U01_0107897, partial [Trifolium medium]|nr:hypothetical protein [Trifolium medium]
VGLEASNSSRVRKRSGVRRGCGESKWSSMAVGGKLAPSSI